MFFTLHTLPPPPLSTPLHIAASDNQLLAAEFLLQNGAAADALDRWGRSPLDCAREAHHTAVLTLLERFRLHERPTPSSSKSLTGPIQTTVPNPVHTIRRSQSYTSVDVAAFFRAIEAGDTETVKRAWLDGLALDVTDAIGRSALHVAVEHRRMSLIELLLSADVDTAALDARGRTPLSVAVAHESFAIAEMLRGHQKQTLARHTTATGNSSSEHHQQLVAQAFRATKRGDVPALRQLVPAHVHPDVQDYDLRSLLHVASAEGHVDIVTYLVECGATVNLLDRWSTSPLTEAIDFAHNDVARVLMAHHGNESGNRAVLAVDQIDSVTLNAALEFTLRVVTRVRGGFNPLWSCCWMVELLLYGGAIVLMWSSPLSLLETVAHGASVLPHDGRRQRQLRTGRPRRLAPERHAVEPPHRRF